MKRCLLASSLLGIAAGSIVARREGGNAAESVVVEVAPKGVVSRREPLSKYDIAATNMQAFEIASKGVVSRRELVGAVSTETQQLASRVVSRREADALDTSAFVASGTVMSRTFSGSLALLDAYTSDSYPGVQGTATLLVTPSKTTSQVTFTGVAEALVGKEFKTHLHDKPCPQGGGKHYQDPSGDGSVTDANENWPIVACSAGGVCIGHAVSTWIPTDAALAAGLSIVIHDTPNNGGAGAGPKMLCADLL